MEEDRIYSCGPCDNLLSFKEPQGAYIDHEPVIGKINSMNQSGCQEKTGIDLYAVCCRNEPDVDLSSHECNWTGTKLKVFIRDYLGPACEKAGITARRMIDENVRNNPATSNPSLRNTAAAGDVDIIDTHQYNGLVLGRTLQDGVTRSSPLILMR